MIATTHGPHSLPTPRILKQRQKSPDFPLHPSPREDVEGARRRDTHGPSMLQGGSEIASRMSELDPQVEILNSQVIHASPDYTITKQKL